MGVVGRTKACLGYLVFLVLISPSVLKTSLAFKDEACDTDDIDECLKKIQTFSKITKLPFATEEKQLDDLCKLSLEGYNCSTRMFNKPDCLSPKDRDLLPVFVSIAQYTVFMLCGDMHNNKGYLREAFLGYSGCIMENKNKMDCCAEETGVPDLPVLRILEDSSKSLATREIQTCCPVSKYLKCTSEVVTTYCGDAAANFSTEYIRRAAGEQTQQVCQKFPKYPEPDPNMCPGPIITCSGASNIMMQHGWMLFGLGLAFLPRISLFFN